MDIKVHPSVLSGTVGAIPSKSVAHRALICAALSGKTIVNYNLSDKAGSGDLPILSEDIHATADCLRSLGAEITDLGGGRFEVLPIPFSMADSLVSNPPLVDCKESGSTLRFLLPAAASIFAETAFTGHGRLPERPLSPLVERMEEHGCTFSSSKLPLSVFGRMSGGTFELPGNVSSQYTTGLLLALPLIGGGRVVLTPPIESKSYIDITVSVLRKFGIGVKEDAGRYIVDADQKYCSPGHYSVEGDWSSAAFWLTAGALGGKISCTGLDGDSTQGDMAVIDVLGRMGANVDSKSDRFAVSRGGLVSVEIDASDAPDLVPILSVAASVCSGVTRIYNAERLRIKESDRLQAVADCLNRLGGKVVERSDGLEITGVKSLTGGTVSSYGDHRIAMSMAVASTVSTGDIVITGAEAVNKSYPAFFEEFRSLGGKYNVINDR